MRKTPIPLLRDLAPGQVITRCKICRELVFMREECAGKVTEVLACPPRAKVDLRGVH